MNNAHEDLGLKVTNVVGSKMIFWQLGVRNLSNFLELQRITHSCFLLDGHASHIKNMTILCSWREHEVHILSFPHCTHRFQSLDVGFMKPPSTYYTKVTNNCLRTNSGRVLTQFQVAELVGILKSSYSDNCLEVFSSQGTLRSWYFYRDRLLSNCYIWY